MRTKIEPESEEDRQLRTKKETQLRHEEASAESRAMDAAVKQSIKMHGA